MKLSKIFQDKYLLFLAICICVASFVTIVYLLHQTVFGFDQARDAFYARSIIFDHDIKIVGPTTDIVGVNHGVLWYYVLSLPYLLARQDPQYAVIFFFILSFSTIPIVWKLSQRLNEDRAISLVSTVLYAFSPLVVAFSSWMSNPILSLYIAPLLLILIWDFIKKPTVKRSLIIGILYGILVQSEIANALLLITLPLFVIAFKVKVKLIHFFLFLTGLLISLSSYILVEIKFNGRGIRAILSFLGNHKRGIPDFGFILGRINDFFNTTTFPFQSFICAVLVVIVFIFLVAHIKRYKKPLIFLLVWLSNILLFTFFQTGVSHSSFVFIPSIAAGAILVGFVIVKMLKNKVLLGVFLLLTVIFQIRMVVSWANDDFSPAAIQRSNTISRYKQAVDYTYRTANNEPFTIVSITNPLFINTTWAYLYEYYGKPKYGYVPFWGGRGQSGYLGSLEEKPFGTKLRYLIIESTIGIPDVYVAKIKYDEEKISDLVEEKRFGYVVVQKRLFHEGKENVAIPPLLKNSPVLYE